MVSYGLAVLSPAWFYPAAALICALVAQSIGSSWTTAGTIGVGLVESFGSFWASAFKEVIVFTVILPILLWRSFVDPHHEEH